MRKDELNLYMDQLWCDGRKCYEDLRDAELETLTGMIMRQCNKSDRWEYINETPKGDELANVLMDLLLTGDPDKATDALHILKSGAKQYAKHRIDKLFENCAECETYRAPSRQPSELELMIAAHHREVARDINSENRRVANA